MPKKSGPKPELKLILPDAEDYTDGPRTPKSPEAAEREEYTDGPGTVRNQVPGPAAGSPWAISPASQRKVEETITGWADTYDMILKGLVGSLAQSLTKAGVNIPGVGTLIVLSFDAKGNPEMRLAPVFPRKDTEITE